AHPFTAGFLGARTVIPGGVRAGRFEAPGLVCADAPAAASAIVLRAARLRLAAGAGPAPAGPLGLAGTLAGAAYLGDAFEIDVDTEAGRVRVLAPSDRAPPPLGGPCRIEALPGAVSYIA